MGPLTGWGRSISCLSLLSVEFSGSFFSWLWLPGSSRYSLEDCKGGSLFSGSFSLARESSLESEKSSPSLLLMGYVRSWLLEHQLTVWTDNVSGADSDLLHRHQQPSSEGSGGGLNWKCNLETEKEGTGKKNSPSAPFQVRRESQLHKPWIYPSFFYSTRQ